MADSDPTLISSYGAFNRQRRLANYLTRGRHLAGIDTEKLKAEWIIRYREWARDLKAPQDHQSREDIEAELDMRGEEIPADPEGFRQFCESMDRAMAEPPTAAEQQRADAEFQEFLASIESPN
jgi:hypothetical protein